jgi:hypothetical protein
VIGSLQVRLALEEWDAWLQTTRKESEPQLVTATRVEIPKDIHSFWRAWLVRFFVVP